jgi:hypothetical protein
VLNFAKKVIFVVFYSGESEEIGSKEKENVLALLLLCMKMYL